MYRREPGEWCGCGLCELRRKDYRKRGRRTVENGVWLCSVLWWYDQANPRRKPVGAEADAVLPAEGGRD